MRKLLTHAEVDTEDDQERKVGDKATLHFDSPVVHECGSCPLWARNNAIDLRPLQEDEYVAEAPEVDIDVTCYVYNSEQMAGEPVGLPDET